MTLVVALAISLFVGLMLLFLSRLVRLATAWGALLGPVFGIWIVAPQIIRLHYLHPDTAMSWAMLGAFFISSFSVLGLLLAWLSSWPLAVGLLLSRTAPNPALLAMVWTGLAVPVAYVGLSSIIQWTFFRQLPHVIEVGAALGRLSWAGLLLAVLGWALQRSRSWPIRQVTGYRLGAGAVVMLLAGLGVLPVRIGRPRAVSAAETPPIVERGVRSSAPLLMIGLDGADWRMVRPLIDQGALPTFGRLLNNGIAGDVRAQWEPYWSTPAWGAILTGYDQDALGVHEDLGATAPGLPPFEVPLTLDLTSNPIFLAEFGLIQLGLIEPAPVSRARLARPPVWERLTAAGRRTGVVFFSFTYPAEGQAAYVVSNRVLPDLWDRFGVKAGARDMLVSPRDRAASILKWFDPDRGVDAAVLRTLLPQPEWPVPRDAVVNPVAVLHQAADVGFRIFNVTEDLIRHDPSLEVMMMYAGDFDSVGHAFYQYRFSRDFTLNPPAPQDVAVLGPVLDRYLQWFDRRLQTIIDAFPSPPNVIIVSDHGLEASSQLTLWRGWHSSRGMFLAAGPDIRHSSAQLQLSYFDVVPTMLDLLGFAPAADLAGRSVLDGSGRR